MKLRTRNNEMKTLQSNHVPLRTDNLVGLRGYAASSHPCKSSGGLYLRGIPDPWGAPGQHKFFFPGR